jgi:tetratricopeptide (TPR) repeat protein
MKPSPHLTLEDYERFWAGELPPRRLIRQLFEHLLHRCPDCRAEWHQYCARPAPEGPTPVREIRRQQPVEVTDRDFDSLVYRTIQRVRHMGEQIAREQEEAKAIYREFQELPLQADRVGRIRRSPRCQTWALCELLLRKSRALGLHAPDEGADLAELAIEVAWALDRNHHSTNTLSDLLARGWALLANARRVGSDLPLAHDTFLMAQYFLKQGSGDPMVTAEVLDLLSSLYRDQGHFDEAARMLVQVVRIYRQAGEEILEGRAYLSLSLVLGEAGEYDRALTMVERAIERVDEEEDPRIGLCCRHARARLILKTGRSEEAHAEWRRLAPRYDAFPEPLIQLRRRWLEGEILEALGRDEEAAAAYRSVCEGFRGLEIPFDAALAALNLAALYIQWGRHEDAAVLVAEIVTVFRSLEVHHEACTALECLHRKLLGERATVEIVRRLSRYLERARRDPARKFNLPP